MALSFQRYIGIDYSGAETPTSSLKGLRIYEASPDALPHEVEPPASPRKYWTRQGIAEWLVTVLSDQSTAIVGIDHGFSFPLQYFEKYGLPHDWPLFLDDFQRHWPTDSTYVLNIREGSEGNGAARSGSSRWRRVTEFRAGAAKSVFHFNCQGQVATSTHAGLTWLRYLRHTFGQKIHFWPFDGWIPPAGVSVVAEVYPRLWNRSFPSQGRTQDQQDAFATAMWLRGADADESLSRFFQPELKDNERTAAGVEGWILGVA